MVSGDQATEEKCPTSPAIHPVLLALACCGNSEGLGYFLHRDEGAAQQYRTDRQGQELLANAATSGLHSDDVEEGAAPPAALSASSALEGVTPEGDTALHAVARSGDGDNFLRSAEVICRAKVELLFALNNNGDAPLHCAARTGNSRMVVRLVALARGDGGGSRVKAMLEMENKLKETALHEAVRVGSHGMVKMLMAEDPELACFPKGGASPLYIAVLKEDRVMAKTMHETSGGNLSYSGPNGQNALHAAALRGPVLTGMLLEWKKGLTAHKDENGSTPLHFAAALPDEAQQTPQDNLSLHSEKTNSAHRKERAHLRFPKCQQKSVCWQLLNADPAELYQPDRHGMYPVHVAASVGATENVTMFVKKYPSSAGLRDSNGRTFLHVAVQKKKTGIVDYASRNHSLSWILNVRDNGGNTALHLAVHSGSLPIFCTLFGNRHVDMNATNKEGQTPLDISQLKTPPEMFYNQNPEALIRRALTMVGARSGACRHDHFEESYNDLHRASEGRGRDAENVKDTTQNLCIGSVLIATVTFGASFALPGGYISDDHANGGTPTLAGRYAFDAFMMANMLAFICSSLATAGFMFSGASMVNLASRKFHLRSSVYFMSTSVTSLTAAFALGVYMVLAPVAYKTAVAMCVLSPSTLLWKNADNWKRWALLPRPFCARKGLYWTLKQFGSLIVLSTLIEFWPFMLIFCWAAYARK